MTLESVKLFGKPKDQYLCSAEIVLSEGSMRFCLRGIRLIDLGSGRIHLAMPAWRKDSAAGTIFEDMFFPMTRPARDFLEQDIIAQYHAYSKRT